MEPPYPARMVAKGENTITADAAKKISGKNKNI